MKKDFKLENIPKQNFYRVPAGYFEKLPSLIMTRVIPSELGTEISWLNRIIYPYRSALIGLILVIGFVSTFLISQNNLPPTESATLPALSTISHSEVIEYLESRGELDSRDLAELTLTDTDVSSEFLNASPEDIRQILQEQPIEEIYLN